MTAVQALSTHGSASAHCYQSVGVLCLLLQQAVWDSSGGVQGFEWKAVAGEKWKWRNVGA